MNGKSLINQVESGDESKAAVKEGNLNKSKDLIENPDEDQKKEDREIPNHDNADN
jgi:hypothetical protein